MWRHWRATQSREKWKGYYPWRREPHCMRSTWNQIFPWRHFIVYCSDWGYTAQAESNRFTRLKRQSQSFGSDPDALEMGVCLGGSQKEKSTKGDQNFSHKFPLNPDWFLNYVRMEQSLKKPSKKKEAKERSWEFSSCLELRSLSLAFKSNQNRGVP